MNTLVMTNQNLQYCLPLVVVVEVVEEPLPPFWARHQCPLSIVFGGEEQRL